MNNIAVSIVVPVFNREGLLDRCIDSLVYQSSDESYEIILVDDHSTDNSWGVMEKWYNQFPEKIKLMKTEGKGVAYCKNTGVRAAKGKYILFVDSDDYTDYKTIARLYGCAVENDFPEMVYSPITRVTGASRQKIASIPQHETIADYLKVDFHFLHGKLFRADLFERFGCLPLLSIGEDVSWVFTVISNLTSIAYFPLPCYFYELSANSITLNNTDLTIVEDIIKGSEYIIEHTNPEYKERAIVYAYTRINSLSLNRPIFKDLISRYLYEHLEQLKSVEDLAERSQVLNTQVEYLEEHFCEIPQRIFVNGFGKSDISDEIEKCAGALRETPEVVVLNESNCDIQVCPVVADAYENGNFEFVGKYFAVKACYEQGGIYIDEDIVIENPFNMLLNDPCFLGFETNDSFTDKVFGACKSNPCFEKLLKTYELPEMYEDRFAPLAERIRTIIVGVGNTVMRSDVVRRPDYEFCLYPVDMFVYTLPNENNIHVCRYKPEVLQQHPDLTEVPLPILKSLWERKSRNMIQKQNLDRLKKDNAWLKKQRTVLQKRIENKEKDIEWLQNRRASLEKNQEWLQGKNARQASKIESLTKDREWLQNKVRRQETKIKELEDHKERHKKQIEKLESNNRILQKKNERIQSSLDEFEASFLARTGLRISRVLRKIKHFFKF